MPQKLIHGVKMENSDLDQEDQIGACQAIIAGISTKADGSISLKLEINPDETKIISRLFEKWAINKRLIHIGMIGIDS